MNAFRSLALAFAISTVSLAAIGGVALSSTAVLDGFAGAVVNQTIDALTRMPVPTADATAAGRTDHAALDRRTAIRL